MASDLIGRLASARLSQDSDDSTGDGGRHLARLQHALTVEAGNSSQQSLSKLAASSTWAGGWAGALVQWLIN